MRIIEMLIDPSELPDTVKNVLKNAYTDLHLEMDIPG